MGAVVAEAELETAAAAVRVAETAAGMMAVAGALATDPGALRLEVERSEKRPLHAIGGHTNGVHSFQWPRLIFFFEEWPAYFAKIKTP